MKKYAFESHNSYQRLAEAVGVRARRFVVVVGSGASSPTIPTWGKLYELLREELEEQVTRSDVHYERLSEPFENLGQLDDYWERFELLQSCIPTEYRNIIRNSVSVSAEKNIPELHRALWTLPIAGVISLNLDTFARRAASQASNGGELKTATGLHAGRLSQILSQPHPFLYELHGTIDDESTWIFTKKQLEQLYATDGYRRFLETIYSQFHVIFIGISADDAAIGGPLQDLAAKKIETPAHYWITSRSDSNTAGWAEKAGVERVEYEDGKHDQAVAMIRLLSTFVAKEEQASPVSLVTLGETNEILPAGELAGRPVEEIRKELNRFARHLLAQEDRDSYDKFLADYDEPIDRAWYVPVNPVGHEIVGYTLQDSATQGAFGSVYRAIDDRGNVVALKLLKRDIRRNVGLLHSFRRGVNAMRILEDRNIPGMVSHKESSEIPTFVTMDWVEGPTLLQAKEARLLEDWVDILDIAIQVGRTILSAHRLPERVLHRDLRPANIMLRDGWAKEDRWNVVVLDFDLATYRHAESESVLADGSALGYLAPEQLGNVKGVSSRSALVDSFGFGMTLLFLVGRREPEAYSHRASDFMERVRGATREVLPAELLATPRRVERLIRNATRDAQSERWGMEIILGELKRLRDANLHLDNIEDDGMFAEEIACRCEVMSQRYEWGRDDIARYQVASGPSIEIRPAGGRTVEVELNWADQGVQERKGMDKYITKKVEAAVDRLDAAGWVVEERKGGRGVMRVIGRCPVSPSVNPGILGRGVDEAVDKLTFR